MKIKPSEKAYEISEQKARAGLPLTPDQYQRLMRSARLSDERAEQRAREHAAERERLNEDRPR